MKIIKTNKQKINNKSELTKIKIIQRNQQIIKIIKNKQTKIKTMIKTDKKTKRY